MQGLYPIIRRKRRPLLVDDAPPVKAGSVEPVQATAKRESREGREGAADQVSDAEALPELDA